jgi:DNA-binding response OmpR family regulator
MGPVTDLRLLVIEDDAGYAQWLRDAFGQSDQPRDVTLTVARTLFDGVSRLRAAPYAAVILDLDLPDSCGLESFRRVSAAAPRVPVIILTARDDEQMASAALREGAQEFLQKGGIDAESLPATVRHSLWRHAYNETLRTTESRYRSLVEGNQCRSRPD